MSDPPVPYGLQDIIRERLAHLETHPGDNGDEGDVEVYDPAPSFSDITDEDEPDYDWLIPGLVERGDRTILTAGEGDGKSTVWRQFCARSSLGLHPFTDTAIDPIRSLMVDCENPRRKVRRDLAVLVAAAGQRIDGARFLRRPEGIDLYKRPDRDWLRAQLEVNKPDLLVLGPVYKIATGNPIDEEVARTVALYLDMLRGDYGIAICLEAHNPYAESGKVDRVKRPYGASLWSRWPEFGLHLAKDGTLTHWRGPRDERQWPAKLVRSSPWPWAVDGVRPGDNLIDALVAILASSPIPLSRTALEKAAQAVTGCTRPAFESARNQALFAGAITARKGARKNETLHSLPAQDDPHLTEEF